MATVHNPTVFNTRLPQLLTIFLQLPIQLLEWYLRSFLLCFVFVTTSYYKHESMAKLCSRSLFAAASCRRSFPGLLILPLPTTSTLILDPPVHLIPVLSLVHPSAQGRLYVDFAIHTSQLNQTTQVIVIAVYDSVNSHSMREHN